MDQKLTRFFRSRAGRITLAGLLVALLLAAAVGQQAGLWSLTGTTLTGTPEPALARISVTALGREGNRDSFSPVISADGRYIAFLSTADNLVDGDDNEEQDVFLYDGETGGLRRLSLGIDGAEANGRSEHLAFAANGETVAFSSAADNLVPGDTNGMADIFVTDVRSGTLRRVSLSAEGVEGNGRSLQPSLSADGRYVAFVSLADNLVPGDDNRVSDIFVYDREMATISRVSRSASGEAANDTSKYPVLSAAGRYVAFQSRASNLAPGDDNGVYDIFVFDRETETIELVSRGLNGGAATQESQLPALSADGRYVAFESWAGNLVADDRNPQSDVFVYDRHTETTELISIGRTGGIATGVNGGATISADARYVAFASLAPLVEADNNQAYDVYLYDRLQKTMTLASVTPGGIAGNGSSISPSLAASGGYVVFDSTADNLVRDDTNDRVDVFIFDPRQLATPPPDRSKVYLPSIRH